MAEITRVDLIKMIATAPSVFIHDKLHHHVIRLNGVDLSGLDMSFLNLDGAELVDANLRGARLVGTRLYRAEISESDLTDADCRGFCLDCGWAVNTSFVRAKMGPLDEKEFPLVIQPWSMLEKAHIESSDFTDADLRQANFSRAGFVDCIFTRAKLDGCNFTDCEVDPSIDRRVLAMVKAAKSKRRKAVRP